MSTSIGIKVRQLRETSNLSQEELALTAGITPDELESIETDRIIPTMGLLVRLSRGMGIRVGSVLDGTEHPGPALSKGEQRSSTVFITGKGESARENLDFHALASQKSDRHMEPYMIEVEFVSEGNQRKSTHEGEEFLYVLKGEVELRYGKDKYPMGEGDSIYFDSIVPHCLSTTKEGDTARVLAVTYHPY